MVVNINAAKLHFFKKNHDVDVFLIQLVSNIIEKLNFTRFEKKNTGADAVKMTKVSATVK